MQELGLQGKHVVLTGAGGALGGAIAALFLRMGANLFLTDRDPARLERLAAELGADPGRLRLAACDVRDSKAVAQTVALAAAPQGIDHLVLAAGIYSPAPVAEMTDEAWHDTLAVNLHGAFYWCRSAAPRMNRGGSIVALSSIAGHRGSGSFSQYAASKGGLLAFARSLAVELAPAVRVNVVSPGPIDSPMVRPLMEKRGEQILAQTPLGKLGTAQDVAQAVAFLASDWARHITGEALQVNGGSYMA